MEIQNRPPPGPWGVYIAVTLIAWTLSAPTSHAAGNPGDNHQIFRHVRTIDSRLNPLIVEGARRSPMFRYLVDRLDRSTVFVYIQSRLLPGDLSGRLTLIAGVQRWRYLRIEIECQQSTDNQIAALGHELQHAVEIADREGAVDQASIRALYGTIGFAIDDSRRRFESNAAKEAGNRIRRELSLRPLEIAWRW